MIQDYSDIRNDSSFIDEQKLMSGFYPAILVSSTKTLPVGSVVLAILPNEVGSVISAYTMKESVKGKVYSEADYHQIIGSSIQQGVLRFHGVVTSLTVQSGSFWCYIYKKRNV